jgi:hypothetical protein
MAKKMSEWERSLKSRIKFFQGKVEQLQALLAEEVGVVTRAVTKGTRKRRRKPMSAAQRRKQSRAMKKYWAARKAKNA